MDRSPTNFSVRSATADLATSALQLLAPEQAHGLAMAALERRLAPRMAAETPDLAVDLAGLKLPNPLGLAAGFDKDARGVDALLGLGFGFVEAGTVTPRPQPGNPRPRLFRLAPDQALINRLGFNNAGLEAYAARLQARAGRPGVVGANIGANKESPDRIGDYVLGLQRVWPLAAYVTVNVSSPNTPGLRGLQERGALEDLLGRLAQARAPLVQQHGQRPLFLKVAPDLDDSAIVDIADLAVSQGVDALIVSNTTIDRPHDLASPFRGEAGGLSGRPLRARSTAVLRSFAQALNGRAGLIGVGGIETARHVLEKLEAGATAVQLYTAFIYGGPALPSRILRDLRALLRAVGHGDVRAAIGARVAQA